MSNTTTLKDVRWAFARMVEAANALGIDTSTVSLQEGSASYGRAFRLVSVDPETGAHSVWSGAPIQGGYLGDTRREAELALVGIWTGFHGAYHSARLLSRDPRPVGA